MFLDMFGVADIKELGVRLNDTSFNMKIVEK
jgi:hypothetical protein